MDLERKEWEDRAEREKIEYQEHAEKEKKIMEERVNQLEKIVFSRNDDTIVGSSRLRKSIIGSSVCTSHLVSIKVTFNLYMLTYRSLASAII